MATRLSLSDRHATLRTIGVAVQPFPSFSSARPVLHSHDIVEMVYCFEGEATHVVNERRYRFGPNALGIVHYSQRHGFVAKRVSLMNIYIDAANFPAPSLAVRLLDVLPRILPLHNRLAHRRNQTVHLQFDEDSEVPSLLRAMAREQEERRPGYLDAMRDYYRLFLTACARQALGGVEGDDLTASSKPPDRFEIIRRHLDETCAEPVRLDELAERFTMAKAVLCRGFKRHTGATVITYVVQRRIEKAMVKLATGDAKVLAVALDVGFNDLSYFTRVFKEIVGCTPGAYRRRLRAAPSESAGRAATSRGECFDECR